MSKIFLGLGARRTVAVRTAFSGLRGGPRSTRQEASFVVQNYAPSPRRYESEPARSQAAQESRDSLAILQGPTHVKSSRPVPQRPRVGSRGLLSHSASA